METSFLNSRVTRTTGRGALILAYPNDASLRDTADEYLFGRDLLVAPVLTPNSSRRTVYLPAGKWMSYNDRTTTYNGGSSVSVDAPLATIPLFVREGAIIVRGDILKSNNNWDADWAPHFRVEVFPVQQAPSEFSYYTGGAVRKIEVKPTSQGWILSTEDLGVPGKFEIYCRGVKAIRHDGAELRSGADYQYDDQQHKLTIPFRGAATFLIEGASSLFLDSPKPR
jgi:alpha-D-xyloside xylohydrolase